jgi:hypothetical protein
MYHGFVSGYRFAREEYFLFFFDVITSLVSIEYGGYGCEKVTSQSEDEMDLTLTSLRVISMVRGHVIRCFRK